MWKRWVKQSMTNYKSIPILQPASCMQFNVALISYVYKSRVNKHGTSQCDAALLLERSKPKPVVLGCFLDQGSSGEFDFALQSAGRFVRVENPRTLLQSRGLRRWCSGGYSCIRRDRSSVFQKEQNPPSTGAYKEVNKLNKEQSCLSFPLVRIPSLLTTGSSNRWSL